MHPDKPPLRKLPERTHQAEKMASAVYSTNEIRTASSKQHSYMFMQFLAKAAQKEMGGVVSKEPVCGIPVSKEANELLSEFYGLGRGLLIKMHNRVAYEEFGQEFAERDERLFADFISTMQRSQGETTHAAYCRHQLSVLKECAKKIRKENRRKGVHLFDHDGSDEGGSDEDMDEDDPSNIDPHLDEDSDQVMDARAVSDDGIGNSKGSVASLNPTKKDSAQINELIISFTQTPAQFGIDRERGESWLNQFRRLCVESGVDQSLEHIDSWRDRVLVTIHATLMTYQSSEDFRGSAQANKAQVESRFPLAEAFGIACRTHAFYLSVVRQYRIMRPTKSEGKIKLSLFCLRMVYAQIACLTPKSLYEKRDLGAIKVEDNAFINEIYSFFGEEREYTDKPRPSESTGDKRKEWELVLASMLGTKLERTGYRERISHLQQTLVSSDLPITSNDDVRWQRFCQALDQVG